MSEHSKLPWTAEGEVTASVYDATGMVVATYIGPKDRDFIVEACNSYRDLRHDLSRQIEIAAELATENTELAARVKELEGTLREAALQIEYLHGKFQETGTGNAVLVRIWCTLAKKEA